MTDTVNTLRDQLAQLKSLHDAGTLGPDAYQTARAALERKLVDLVTSGAATPTAASPRPSKVLWMLSGVVTVLVAAGGYWWTGTPEAVGAKTATATQEPAAGSPHALGKEQIATMAEKLAARLKDRPDDAEGWSMLGRSYMVLEKPVEALAAYERAVKLRPDDAATLTDYADALAVKNDRSLAGEPMKFIERALKLEPDNLKALMLAGTAAFNANDYAKAVKHWDRMAQVGPADHPMVQSAMAGAEEARRRGSLPPTPASAAVPAAQVKASATAPTITAAPAAPGTSVSGTVTISAAAKAAASPDDTVFVFARPAEGSRMPLAILRKQVKDLPLTFKLDDSMAMSPAAKISTAGRVVVGARISKSGQAMPQPGDMEGLSDPVNAGATGVTVTISSAVK